MEGGEAAGLRLERAASGRLIRSALTWSGDPADALERAGSLCKAVVRPAAVAAASLSAPRGGYVVSIRRDDRERFEDTMDGVSARWIGETGAGF